MAGEPTVEPGRGDRMAERVRRTARERGFASDAVRMLGRVHELAMAPRLRALEDDHDPRYLHPGRVAAILMDDLACGDPDRVALGMVFDSEDRELEAPDGELPSGLRDRRAALPRPEAAGELLEALVTLEAPLLDLVLAERLDPLRHIHLLEDVDRARSLYAQAAETYARAATRGHPVLTRRYAWWTRRFGARFST